MNGRPSKAERRRNYLIQIEVIIGHGQAVALLVFLAKTLKQLVKHVVVSLLGGVRHNARFLQQVFGDFGSGDDAAAPEKKQGKK